MDMCSVRIFRPMVMESHRKVCKRVFGNLLKKPSRIIMIDENMNFLNQLKDKGMFHCYLASPLPCTGILSLRRCSIQLAWLGSRGTKGAHPTGQRLAKTLWGA